MAYHEQLADRVRAIIAETHNKVEEKKMFGGLCFMVNGKMCVGVEKERLMLRFDPLMHDEVMLKKDCQPMDFTGRVMKGYAFISLDNLNTKRKLNEWLQLALSYNKKAKASKKKRKPVSKKK